MAETDATSKDATDRARQLGLGVGAATPAVSLGTSPGTPRPDRRPAIWGRALALPILVVAALFWFAGEAQREEARVAEAHPGMRVDTALPAFELIERSGQRVSNATLAGKPYIAAFVFTRCQGPCPALVSTLRRLQAEMTGENGVEGPLTGADLRLVSVSVDPANDTPEVLKRYAASVTADAERWLFLTGEPAAVLALADGFHLGVVQNPRGATPNEVITHDTHLALVDAAGRLRGYYDSTDADSLRQLERDGYRQSALAAPGRRSFWPIVNATLNGLSAVLLVLGYAFIRKGDVARHKATMVAAFAVSAAFLGCYLVYHAQCGSTPFAGDGTPRTAYRVLLASHVILAVVVLPFELATLWLGLKGRLGRHVTLARGTFPVWLYVAVTGVAVYLLLYRIFV